MVKRADAGDIVDQEAVPIGHDDTAQEVFAKCVTAARLVLERQLDALTAGTAPRRSQDESQATYFGGRKPEDGRIDWTQSAESIYNLIRAVTHPYPGAFTDGQREKAVHLVGNPSPVQAKHRDRSCQWTRSWWPRETGSLRS